MSITKLFIANRAEIACRIAQTARKMGIRSCGVYTPQDASSRHVRVLDEVAVLSAGDLSTNYLNQRVLIETAQRFGAQAVHPGYGFLSENPEFAERVMAAGLIWVGPNPAAMRALGGKIEAKEVAARAHVPVAPWMKISEEVGDEERQWILQQIGLPLLIKAAHGGGGRGQRVVTDERDFAESLRAARSEALRSFGSSEVFVERFLDRPRHIEAQVIADEHGNVCILGERDCTLQRRNQKVIEEAPATVLDYRGRQKIHAAARALAEAVGYTNAGTIEFLVQQSESGAWEFFFMELNARLQVEHPVTEMIRGVDLVELQLRAAQGENLKEEFERIAKNPVGHAMELRLCAENPEADFLPTPGPITQFTVPAVPGLRLDTGFVTGDTIPQEYDSMFAKMIFCGKDRDDTIRSLIEVLDQTMIAGIITNKFLLRSVLTHPEFRGNSIYTRWFQDHAELLLSSTELDEDLQFWSRKFCSELFVQRGSRGMVGRASLPAGGAGCGSCSSLTAFIPSEDHGISSLQGLVRIAGAFVLEDGSQVAASGWITRFEMCITFSREVRGVGQKRIQFASQYETEESKTHHHGPLMAQVPGLVLDVRAKVDDIVEPRVPILVIEAMKIEMPMSLPVAAKIIAINVKQGDRILPGQPLVLWEPAL
jgi:acetyl/propionyl-CoA carboxylase alpha subunit